MKKKKKTSQFVIEKKIIKLCIFKYYFREDMEKVNIVFHNNGTVTYQHKKILNFVPELSKDSELQVVVPNIPLLVCLNKIINKLILFTRNY